MHILHPLICTNDDCEENFESGEIVLDADNQQFFILDLKHDPHAKDALLAYADSCQMLSPVKAEELRIVAGKL